jgi:phosphoglycerate dehydrogenase-like enzyme/predicted dehydrogenase
MAIVPRALVVGAGEAPSQLHFPVLATLRDEGRLELVEICDLRQASAVEMQQRFGFARNSADAAAAIARSDVDVVYLFGGARMHHALGMAAVRSGKHLFVEKPIAPSYAEAAELAHAAQWRGLIAAGGHNRRFLAAFDHIRHAAGVGCWTSSETLFHKPAFGRPPPFGAATWLTGNGIHALDALVSMMGGLPEWLAAQASGAGPAATVFSAVMRWPNGAQAVLLSNNEAGARREEYVFHAPGESWRVSDERLTVERGGKVTRVDLPAAHDSFAAEHEAFLAAIATREAPPHAISTIAPSLFLAELIESGHHGAVRLPGGRTSPSHARREQTVMLIGAERLRSALSSMPSHWRLVSAEELDRSPAARPDITAAIIAPGADALTAETLDKLPNLKVVGVIALSLRRYNPDLLLDRGLTLVNASRTYAESVAEFALGLAILARRRAFNSSEAMRSGNWGTAMPGRGARGALVRLARRIRPVAARLGIERRLARIWRSRPSLVALSDRHGPPSRDLAGALVGLIGWGANAGAFTRRLVHSGARVIVHSDHASPEEIRACGAQPAPLASVLAADIVSLHRGLSPKTRHCIGAAELGRLRPGAVLINVARGALIDPDALNERLARGDVFACLDTFEQEPLPRRHPLRRMRNVFLTAHIAGGSADMHAAAAREVIDKVAACLEGGPMAVVTAERLATMT